MSGYREQAALAWTDDSVRLIATPSAFARAALYYVQEVGRFRTLPPYYTEREQLDSLLVVYTAAGKGRLQYKDAAYVLRPGDVFFIDCMEYQFYATDPVDCWELLWVHLSGGCSRAYYEQYTAGGGPVQALPEASGVPALLGELVRVHQVRDRRTELVASKLLVELLTELLLVRTGSGVPEAEPPAAVAFAMRYIDRHYRERIALDDLARRCATDKYQLAKSFRRHAGCSPGEYIIRARITRAMELLKYADIPVAQVAEEVGIDNVSHFINLFKARVSLTPLAYRKQWQSHR